MKFFRQGWRRTLLVAAVCVLAGCGGDRDKLVDSWVNVANDKTINLFKDGTGVSANENITWKIDGKRFVVMMKDNTAFVGEYSVKGDIFTWTPDTPDDDNDSGAVTWVRKSKAEEYKKKMAAEEEARQKKIMEEVLEREEKIAAEEQKRLDSISEYFTDERDGQKYRMVKIGSKRWIAQNLNYQTGKSWCYENDTNNCAKYGRLYDWNTAKKACPAGYHLPSTDEWDNLAKASGGKYRTGVTSGGQILESYVGVGNKLKTTKDWYYRDDVDRTLVSGNGTDNYGFSALPGGSRSSYDSSFGDINKEGKWWTATDGDWSGAAYYRNLDYGSDEMDVDGFHSKGKEDGLSVRCVKNK
jgi:uncharacterized protein (TIGR02145 family)